MSVVAILSKPTIRWEIRVQGYADVTKRITKWYKNEFWVKVNHNYFVPADSPVFLILTLSFRILFRTICCTIHAPDIQAKSHCWDSWLCNSCSTTKALFMNIIKYSKLEKKMFACECESCWFSLLSCEWNKSPCII